MVDTEAGIDRQDGMLSLRDKQDSIQFSIVSGKEACATYEQVVEDLAFAPPQHPRWISAWCSDIRADPIVATLTRNGDPAMALALNVVSRGTFGVARFPGGSHANGNFPATGAGASLTRDAVDRLARSIAEARPDIDVLALERQLPRLCGRPNPLHALRHGKSSDVALAADLSGGFEALLGRVSGKRKRKKHRSQARKFEAAGGFRHFPARTPDEVDRVLDAFFVMRAERLATAGVPNAFADAATQAAFGRLFRESCAAESPAFLLQALEVGGKLRAVSGSSRRGDTLVCEFTGFANDDLADAAPGDFLFYENIRTACEEGFAVYDFSVGDERYKREWCDIETCPFEVFVPLTAKGRLLAETHHGIAASKRFIKTSPLAMDLAKRVRRAWR